MPPPPQPPPPQPPPLCGHSPPPRPSRLARAAHLDLPREPPARPAPDPGRLPLHRPLEWVAPDRGDADLFPPRAPLSRFALPPASALGAADRPARQPMLVPPSSTSPLSRPPPSQKRPYSIPAASSPPEARASLPSQAPRGWPAAPARHSTGYLPPAPQMHRVSRPSILLARPEQDLGSSAGPYPHGPAPFYRSSTRHELDPSPSPQTVGHHHHWVSSVPISTAPPAPAPSGSATTLQETDPSGFYRPDSPSLPQSLSSRSFSSTHVSAQPGRWAPVPAGQGPSAAAPSSVSFAPEDWPTRSERSSSSSSRISRAGGPSRGEGAEPAGPNDQFLPIGRLLNPFTRSTGGSRAVIDGSAEKVMTEGSSSHDRPARLGSASSASASKTTTSSSGPTPASGATTKRQTARHPRQFKYLTERPAPQQAKDSLKPKDAADARKKVKRACVYCKRSHMPCSPLRPCARCVKRGIAHLCKDDVLAGDLSVSLAHRRASSPGGLHEPLASLAGEPATAEPDGTLTVGGQFRELTASLPASLPVVPSFGQTPSRAVHPGAESGSDQWSLAGTSSARALDDNRQGERLLYEASKDALHVCKLLAGPDAGSTEAVLDSTILPSESPAHEGPMQALIIDNPPLRRLLQYPHSVVAEEALTLVSLHADRQDGVGPWGFGQVAMWLRDGFDEELRQTFDRILGSIRLRFLRRSLYLSDQQLHSSRQAMHTSLDHYRLNLFETVPHAMALISRSGVVMAGNRRMCSLVQLVPSTIYSGQVLYFDLVARPDMMRVMESYASAVDSVLPSPWVSGAHAHIGAASGGAATLTHDFIVDRQALLHGTRAWNHQVMDYYAGADQELDDGSPTVIHFRGLVTLQLVPDDTGIPAFIAVYAVLA